MKEQKSERRGNVEVRLNEDGSVDEVLIYHPETGKCLFHMEQMDDHYFWMRAGGTEGDLVANVVADFGFVTQDVFDPSGKMIGQAPSYGPRIEATHEWEDGNDVPVQG